MQRCINYTCLNNKELEFIIDYYKIHTRKQNSNWYTNNFMYPIYLSVYLNIKIETLDKGEVIGNTIIMIHKEDTSNFLSVEQLIRKDKLEKLLENE